MNLHSFSRWGLGLPPTYKPQCPKYGFIFWGGDSIMPEYCHLRVPLLVPMNLHSFLPFLATLSGIACSFSDRLPGSRQRGCCVRGTRPSHRFSGETAAKEWLFMDRRKTASLRGSHLSNTTCLTQVFVKRGEQCSKVW